MGERTTRESRASSEAMEQAAEFVRRREQSEPGWPLTTLALCVLVAACAFVVPLWVSSMFDEPPPPERGLPAEPAAE